MATIILDLPVVFYVNVRLKHGRTDQELAFAVSHPFEIQTAERGDMELAAQVTVVTHSGRSTTLPFYAGPTDLIAPAALSLEGELGHAGRHAVPFTLDQLERRIAEFWTAVERGHSPALPLGKNEVNPYFDDERVYREDTTPVKTWIDGDAKDAIASLQAFLDRCVLVDNVLCCPAPLPGWIVQNDYRLTQQTGKQVWAVDATWAAGHFGPLELQGAIRAAELAARANAKDGQECDVTVDGEMIIHRPDLFQTDSVAMILRTAWADIQQWTKEHFQTLPPAAFSPYGVLLESTHRLLQYQTTEPFDAEAAAQALIDFASCWDEHYNKLHSPPAWEAALKIEALREVGIQFNTGNDMKR
jgi:hypothetical protein